MNVQDYLPYLLDFCCWSDGSTFHGVSIQVGWHSNFGHRWFRGARGIGDRLFSGNCVWGPLVLGEKPGRVQWFWSNYSDLTRPQKVAFWKGNPRLFQGNLGWWIMIIWMVCFFLCLRGGRGSIKTLPEISTNSSDWFGFFKILSAHVLALQRLKRLWLI